MVTIESDLIQKIRQDPSVHQLQLVDPEAEIYINLLDERKILQIEQEYPGFFPEHHDFIYSVNVISSQMWKGMGYKKIRLYYSLSGDLLKRFETGKN
jgi:hypothetical protein